MRKLGLFALALALFAAPALAEEVIYFTNGSSMPILDHIVEEEMVKVDLGEAGFMAFPMTQVDRIEKAGREVYQNPSRANQMFAKPKGSGGSEPVYGRRPSAFVAGKKPGVHNMRPDQPRDPNITTDANGLTVYSPLGEPASVKNRLLLSGHSAIRNAPVSDDSSNGIVGTRAVGNKHQMDPPGGADEVRKPIAFGKVTAARPKPAPPASTESADQGASDE